MTKLLSDRLWSKVDRSGGPDACWPWTGSTRGRGYGSIRMPYGLEQAHRVAYELTHGRIPSGRGHHGTCVLHRCDNPRCCNPAHLFLGSHGENMRDKARKGRCGYRLTGEIVDQIRAEYGSGAVSQQDLATRFGITVPMVSMIVNRKTWAWR